MADWRTSVTLVGWLVTLKCALYLFFPRWIGFAQKWSDAFVQRYITVAGGAIAHRISVMKGAAKGGGRSH